MVYNFTQTEEYSKNLVNELNFSQFDSTENPLSILKLLCQFLSDFKNISILLKGSVDIIIDCNSLKKQKFFVVGIEGSKKRCGGQGDILAGLLAVNHNFSWKQQNTE